MGNTNESKLDFDDERDVMNVEEAADFLRCCISGVYRDSALGLMPHIRNGRRLLFLRSDLLRWLEGKRQEVVQT